MDVDDDISRDIYIYMSDLRMNVFVLKRATPTLTERRTGSRKNKNPAG